MKDLIKKQTDMIRKESGMNITELSSASDKSVAWLWHTARDIYEVLLKIEREVNKHSVAKKDRKIKKTIKNLYKATTELRKHFDNLKVGPGKRGY